MSDDWLQLTEEDIARAQRLTRARPVMTEIITITRDEIPAEPPPAPPRRNEAILTITREDLTPTPPQASTTADLRELETLMFALVNTARQHNLPGWLGTARLKWHDGLAAVARGHSADMLRRQYVAHVTPEGITAARRIERHGVGYVACGENIGIVYGETTNMAQAVHDIHNAFMNQPRSLTNHRGNLLNPIWTHVGIGVAYTPDGSLVATQNFISAPAARLRGR
ncbi:MAG: CAP domain-containing protein [Chloroflexi bacterium]|nr:CAP domain-containing protein [Chloroflexota bacterium]MCI0578111.1 CAP domain-containing protein [Chloroflexota bacterium]MCI0644415.1 CAP domain-containing protein [Chloroflexota bacterium]MCI0727925.1 CAP domain-containing protein [Chloroflexota bacterium]